MHRVPEHGLIPNFARKRALFPRICHVTNSVAFGLKLDPDHTQHRRRAARKAVVQAHGQTTDAGTVARPSFGFGLDFLDLVFVDLILLGLVLMWKLQPGVGEAPAVSLLMAFLIALPVSGVIFFLRC